jgi:hypothetical protein
MIGLFIKRGWFWELMFSLLVLELARARTHKITNGDSHLDQCPL